MLEDIFGFCFLTMDRQRSMKFYCDLLGLEHKVTLERPRYTLTILGVGEYDVVNLFEYKDPNDIDPIYPHVAFKVGAPRDVEAKLAELRKRLEGAGHHVTEVMGNLFVKDPDGNAIELSNIPVGVPYVIKPTPTR
ncbi:MAG: VOC family protein [Candidatus Tectomicrobia bacterium]|nr:VOC family protein [Candidatus Tectomicrobia bacterium]